MSHDRILLYSLPLLLTSLPFLPIHVHVHSLLSFHLSSLPPSFLPPSSFPPPSFLPPSSLPPPSFLSYIYMCTSTCTCMYILCSSNSQTTLNLISQSVEISQRLEVPAKNITLKVSTHLYIVHVHTVCTLYTWNVLYCTLILFSLLKCVCTFLLHRVPKVR